MKRFLSTFVRNERGVAGAEMALMLPLLMILMFGSFEMGHFFWTQHTLTKAVRDGARFAARQPFALFNCAAGTISGAALAQYSGLSLTEAVQNVTVYGQPTEGTAKVKDWDITEVEVEISCAASAVDGSGDTNVETGLYQNVGNAQRGAQNLF